MTYIAAFHCAHGIVMCADTLESVGEFKEYVEKLSIIEDRSYPLAIGGAGSGDLIDCSIEEIIERTKASKPATKKDMAALIKAALSHVYEKDLPTLAIPKQHRTPELLIAAKPTNDEFCLFWTKGRRVKEEVKRGIIGYSNPYNRALLKRLHSDSMPMPQAVILASYLVSQSKTFDEGVGGETRVAVVVGEGAFFDDKEYLDKLEVRAKELLDVLDKLFFLCSDVTIPNDHLISKVEAINELFFALRNKYMLDATLGVFHEITSDENWSPPYGKLPKGAEIQTRGRTVLFSDHKPIITQTEVIPGQKFRVSIPAEIKRRPQRSMPRKSKDRQ